jgi:FkbM family methyltransferase
MYYSQFGQDKFLNEYIFKNKRNGIFVDIGALDGISMSNTYFFEKFLDWTGICIEPNTYSFNKLVINRNSCINLNVCVDNYDGECDFLEIDSLEQMCLSGIYNKYDSRHIDRIKSETLCSDLNKHVVKKKTRLLNNILEEFKYYHIDYCSMDTEGNELDIFNSIDLNKYKIDVITIENNYNMDFKTHFENKGYFYYTKLNIDELYVSNRLK